MICFQENMKAFRELNRKRSKKHHPCIWLTCHFPRKSNEFVATPMDYESPDLVFDILWFMRVNFRMKSTKTYCEKVIRNFLSFIFVLGLFYTFSIRMRSFIVEDKGAMIVTEMLAFLCSIVLWISLNMQRHKIIAVNGATISDQMFPTIYNNGNSRRQRWINLISLITISAPIFTSALSMVISKITGEDINKHLTFLCFGFQLNVRTLYKYPILFLLRSFDLYICFASSQMICLLFSILSYNVHIRVKETEKQFETNVKDTNVLYSSSKALKSYKRMQKIILNLEKAISLPLFYVIAFLLCELFALMSNIIHLVRRSNSSSSLCVVVSATLLTGFHAVMLIFRVSSVEESYHSLIRTFVNLPDDNLSPPYVKELLQMLKLLAYHDQLYLTAWGMIPVRRGLFLTVVGTLATYGVLLVQFT
ncbi:uncharacterized protein NPIL_570391 [Nephila pilipes]|uniref:Gustatory receptor n=1 Tax=Nephila pilipes TaxID=299642 RepID=A0A8X6I8F8_NEPPI|nr:uncharacterized protein NPIL_570391 [Nephila pilipes]